MNQLNQVVRQMRSDESNNSVNNVKPSPLPRTGPAPPAKGRPAPPAKGRPAPPPTSGPPAPPHLSHEDVNPQLKRARDLEQQGEYSEAAILYRALGAKDDENRCLQLALSKAERNQVTNIHHGDNIIQDSVVMKDD